MPRPILLAALASALMTGPAAAQEAFVGAYVHGVDTPFTLRTEESGADLQAGVASRRRKASASSAARSPI